MNGATPLSPDIQAQLAKLRDIRLPDPVGWWPLAPGWWVLIAFVLAAAAVALWYEIRRRRSARYLALHELDTIRARIKAAGDPAPIAVDLAVLLRRVALNKGERGAVTGISGKAWADRLSDGASGLSAPVARLLSDAPYAPPDPGTDTQTLLAAADEAEGWIRRQAC